MWLCFFGQEFKEAIAGFVGSFKGPAPKGLHQVAVADGCGTAELLAGLSREERLRGECVLVLPGEALLHEALLDLVDLHLRAAADLTMLVSRV